MKTLLKASFFERLALTLSCFLSLAAIGGCGGQSQGGLVPFGAPSAAGQIAAASATSGASQANAAPPGSVGATSGTSAVSAPPILEQIEALERSGAYPALDRSSDIAGPDANSNGVRDDIEAWIQSLQVNDAQRKALMQEARALQKTLTVDLTDREALQRSGDELMASGKCGSIQFSPYAEFSKLNGKIEAMTANTRERAGRYLKYNAASSGSSNRLPSGNTCEP